jgi:hypothetical protein
MDHFLKFICESNKHQILDGSLTLFFNIEKLVKIPHKKATPIYGLWNLISTLNDSSVFFLFNFPNSNYCCKIRLMFISYNLRKGLVKLEMYKHVSISSLIYVCVLIFVQFLHKYFIFSSIFNYNVLMQFVCHNFRYMW